MLPQAQIRAAAIIAIVRITIPISGGAGG